MQINKNLEPLKAELQFIRRHVNNLQTSDFDEVDEINIAIASAERALIEHELLLAPACGEIPEGLSLPGAA